jgi:PIN domain nuclease of toxin-antitoxin system
MIRPRAVLLDTCAIIWLANGISLPPATVSIIIETGEADGMFVSTASAWEIGLLTRPRPDRPPALLCQPDPKAWFARFLTGPGIRHTPITPGIAIDSSHLPGDFHADPADWLIIATARHLGMPIVTSDHTIIAYANAAHVAVIPC